jgi:large subunit ribosomal protein L17
MRHRKSFNHLSRKKGHRKAMLANMAASLILHKRIKTTTAKAKALRTFVEPLITKSKNDSTHSRRVVFSHLQNKDAVTELFREVSPKIADRPGGYTRILKTGFRLGDNADMCVIELVDYNENLLAAKSETEIKTGKRRRRGSRKKAAEELQVPEKPETGITSEAEETAVAAEQEAIVEKEEDKMSPEDIKEEKTEIPADTKEAGEAKEPEDVTGKEGQEEPSAEAKDEEKTEIPADTKEAGEAKEPEDVTGKEGQEETREENEEGKKQGPEESENKE